MISDNSSLLTAEKPAIDKAIRVMVVDDAIVIRGLMSRWLGEEDGIEVVAKHANGKLAVDDLLASNPDVVVLDIEMPEMDGLTALEKMMALKPELIVIMASTLTRRNAEISLKALNLGASDYIPKPESNSGVTTSKDFRSEVIEKVRVLGMRAMMRRRRGLSPVRPNKPAQPAKPAALPEIMPSGMVPSGMVPSEMVPSEMVPAEFELRPITRVRPQILAIGSSTGGPKALLALLEELAPRLKNIPTIITQHMPPTFTAILAQHIQKATNLVAKEAEHGEQIEAGNIYVAPGAKHFTVINTGSGLHAQLDDGPQINFCKPAVDPMFESAVSACGNGVLGVVLTGMGHDGRDGSKAIVDAGGNVLAQDEETSVVWGMPGSVAEAGLCVAVLPLTQIAGKIETLLGASSS